MNTQRAMNMIFRMAMRHGMRLFSRAAKNSGDTDGKSDRRAFRGTQPEGEAGKRMRALKRFTKF